METLRMAHVVAFAFIVANLVSCGRLLSYRRAAGEFKFRMSFLAYVLIVSTGGQAIAAMLQPEPISIWASVLSIVLCVLIVRAKGNVASLVRVA